MLCCFVQSMGQDFVLLGAKPQDLTALSIDYVVKM